MKKNPTMSQSSPLLALKDIEKTVETGSTKLTILQGLNLEIKAGESVAIVGASGSGKSTLLGLMAGLDSATQGDVFLLGQNLSRLTEDERAFVRAQGVGFVFQNFQLLPSLTALENVSLPIEMHGTVSAKEAEAAATRWLDKVGLSHRLTHYPRQLSGGEQQRVAVARAFAANPKILFADEPTGNLDRDTGHSLIEQIFALNEESHTTLVLVTHDEHLAQRCERILCMENGQLSEQKSAGSSDHEALAS